MHRNPIKQGLADLYLGLSGTIAQNAHPLQVASGSFDSRRRLTSHF